MIITVIGLGLIGGSIALDLKKANFSEKIIGVDNNPDNCKMALELNIADEIDSLPIAYGLEVIFKAFFESYEHRTGDNL